MRLLILNLIKKNKYLKHIASIIFSNNLSKLSLIHETDKYGVHFYTQHYQQHFNRIKKQRLKILEIGIGGYDNPNKGGNSLIMWSYYFTKSKIYSFDLHKKDLFLNDRIKILQGDQADNLFLQEYAKNYGPFDIIIDDGSHKNADMINTFNILFYNLNNRGIYVFEDIQTSYWKDYGGDTRENLTSPTIMNYIKNLIDGLNYEEFMIENYQPTYFNKNIFSIHLYHNLIFICKGNNTEGSNIVKNGKRIDL